MCLICKQKVFDNHCSNYDCNISSTTPTLQKTTRQGLKKLLGRWTDSCQASVCVCVCFALFIFNSLCYF
jgi:hypothetical protein